MKILSDGEVLDSLREIVAGKEDFVYEPPEGDREDYIICRYVHDDEPGCLIGHWLYSQGASLEKMCALEGLTASESASDFLDLSPLALHALEKAQIVQDGGGTWGEALERAEEVFGA